MEISIIVQAMAIKIIVIYTIIQVTHKKHLLIKTSMTLPYILTQLNKNFFIINNTLTFAWSKYFVYANTTTNNQRYSKNFLSLLSQINNDKYK